MLMTKMYLFVFLIWSSLDLKEKCSTVCIKIALHIFEHLTKPTLTNRNNEIVYKTNRNKSFIYTKKT